MDESQRPSVFLSYTREDLPYVSAVADGLRQQGIGARLDSSGLTPGDRWADAMAAAIDSASLVAVFVSDAAAASPSVNFEIGAAVGARKRLFPVLLGGTNHVPVELAGVQYLDAHASKPEQVAGEIARALQAAGATG